MVTIQKTNQPMSDVLLPLTQRKGIISCRYIGFDKESQYYEDLASFYNKLKGLPSVYFLFEGKVPINSDFDLTNRIDKALTPVQESDISNGDVVCVLSEFVRVCPNAVGNDTLVEALKNTLILYAKQETMHNLSIAKNFANKLTGWIIKYVSLMFKEDCEYNPKVLYYGNIKPHEVYFLIFLAQIGCDILYFNPQGDNTWEKIDRCTEFAYLLEKSQKGEMKPFPKQSQACISRTKCDPKEYKERIAVIAKETRNLLEDFVFPVSRRSEYVGNPLPILPVYFYRYLGMEGLGTEALDEYHNTLYRLDRKLQSIPNKYLKFTSHIPMPSYDESSIINPQMEQQLNRFGDGETDALIRFLVGLLPNSNNSLMNNTLGYAFQTIAQIYPKRELNFSIATYKNFLVKLVLWIRRYWGQLQTSNHNEFGKVLFYGDIKPHEVYLLLFLSQIGCDVLFVSSDKKVDEVFQRIDPTNEFSKVLELKDSIRLEPFPTMEKTVRKTTVAYNASQEIQSAIYGGDVGLFKPWQLLSFKTSPVTLKTTYDELKILWKEESKVRSEFRVEGDTVYIPNLFAKINGISSDMGDYWRDFGQFASTPDTLVIKKLPFTTVSYTKRDLFSLDFLFNKQGLVDYDSVVVSPFYKMGFLNTSLQKLLIQKINELIASDRFKIPVNDVFRLKILMTVLTLDERIVKLIERFDYPSFVPKLVIFDNERELSDEDAIVLAYLNLLGLDIVVFVPTNYNTVEQKIHENFYDIHQLDSVAFDLQIPEQSLNNPSTGGKKSFKQILLDEIFGNF